MPECWIHIGIIYLYSNANNPVTYFHWKIIALAGIRTWDLPGTKPICFPGLYIIRQVNYYFTCFWQLNTFSFFRMGLMNLLILLALCSVFISCQNVKQETRKVQYLIFKVHSLHKTHRWIKTGLDHFQDGWQIQLIVFSVIYVKIVKCFKIS